MAINLYRVVLPTTMGTYAAAGSLLAYSSDFAQSVIMRLWSILSFAVGLSMANPIAGLNEEMKGEIEAAIRKLEPKLNAFDLNTFATNVERRDDAEDLVSVSNPLLVARQNTCPCGLSDEQTRLILSAAEDIAKAINSNASLIGLLGTLRLIDTLGTVFAGLASALAGLANVGNPAVVQAFQLLQAAIAK